MRRCGSGAFLRDIADAQPAHQTKDARHVRKLAGRLQAQTKRAKLSTVLWTCHLRVSTRPPSQLEVGACRLAGNTVPRLPDHKVETVVRKALGRLKVVRYVLAHRQRPYDCTSRGSGPRTQALTVKRPIGRNRPNDEQNLPVTSARRRLGEAKGADHPPKHERCCDGTQTQRPLVTDTTSLT